MRPRTLRRRGLFYHRKRNRWRLNLALALIGAALAGCLVVVIVGPTPGPAEDTAKRIAAPASTTPAPTRAAPAELGSTTLIAAASAPIPARPPRPGRPGSLVAERSPGSNRRDVNDVGARLGAPTVHDAQVEARAPDPRMLAGAATHSPAQAEGCKTCGDDVPF